MARKQRTVSLVVRMMRVTKQPREKDGEAEKALREMMEKNPEVFFAQYERQEAKRAERLRVREEARKRKAEGGVSEALPAGSEREEQGMVLEAIRRLREAWGEKYGSGVAGGGS